MAIALLLALGATAASAYVKGQSQKEYLRAVSNLRSQQAELGERRAREQEALTRETSKKFQPEERTALTEKQDQENRESLSKLHENLNVGPEEGSEQKFAGKISKGFENKLAGQRGTTKQRSAALREAQARFNSTSQAGEDESQLLRNLGIDNNTIKSFMAGDQRAIDAKIAGLSPGGTGLSTFLDALGLIAGAYAIGGGGAAAGASSTPISEASFLGEGAGAGAGFESGTLGMTGGTARQGFAPLNFTGTAKTAVNPFNYDYLTKFGYR
jgi:hypothetical protein